MSFASGIALMLCMLAMAFIGWIIFERSYILGRREMKDEMLKELTRAKMLPDDESVQVVAIQKHTILRVYAALNKL